MPGYHFFMPTEVFFGEGVVDQVGDQSARLGHQALVVTGKESSRRSGALDRVVMSLRNRGLSVEVFDQVEENPSDQTVQRGARQAREQDCDVIVALGGGSPMDAAKGIAVLASQGGVLADYYGADKVASPVLPVVALPTTAGTGSEVTPYAVFVESKNRIKRSMASSHIYPRVALLDPLITVSMSSRVTANTGIDALTHALEGFTSVGAQPFSDLLALESITLIDQHLPRAVDDGNDLLARAQILHASMLAGMVIAQTGTTLIHGMGYAPTTWYGIPHGLANGVLMPQVVTFNGQQDPHRYARLAAALGGSEDPSRGAEWVAQALRRLRDRVKMPSRLRDLGVAKKDLKEMARQTMQHTRNLDNNARAVSLEDVLRIYQESY